MKKTQTQPVIILSAARSGSKLLRDILASSRQIQVVPYDINYIWKYSNNHLFHDELDGNDLDEKIASYIQRQILKFADNEADKYIVEKTVSNTLRVGFVKSVFPDAKLVHLYRDGRDVALSALDCWTSGVIDSKNQSLKTYFQKLIGFPYFTASDYLIQRCKEVIAQKLSSQSHYYWGPRFDGIKEMVSSKSLAEVCAYQWVNSIESTLKQLETFHLNSDYISIKYEQLVETPEDEIQKLCYYLGISDTQRVSDYARNKVSTNSIGRWNQQFKLYEKDILPIMQSSLAKLGYLSITNEQCA